MGAAVGVGCCKACMESVHVPHTGRRQGLDITRVLPSTVTADRGCKWLLSEAC